MLKQARKPGRSETTYRIIRLFVKKENKLRIKEEHMKTLLISVVLCMLILFGASVFAQDSTAPTVTFKVPIHFTDLHQDIIMIRVACWLYLTSDISHGSLGSNNLEIPCPADGNINQTVTIVVSQLPGTDITQATHYEVLFYLESKDLVWGVPNTRDLIEYKAKPGTPLTASVNGEIHW
jgi:hypothetical protein